MLFLLVIIILIGIIGILAFLNIDKNTKTESESGANEYEIIEID